MDIKITEVSLSFVVSGILKTHVGKEMPFVANTIGDDVERVISTTTMSIPWWIHDPQPDTIRFVYSCCLQDVECSYSGARSTITFQGIKYKNMDKFNAHIDTVLNLIGVEHTGPTTITTRYKAVAKADLRAPWDQDKMADVITNDSDIVQSMAVCERMSTLGNKRLFSAVIGDVCRVALTHANGQIVAMMSKLPDEEASLRAADVLKRLIAKYETKWMTAVPSFVRPAETAAHSILELRDKLPELFVNNYTRECPILPIMVPEFEVHEWPRKRVILYPTDGEYARYYTAPEGYFVGLKRNRLANKEIFPCLVTCYLQNHIERKGSETQTYYAAAADTVEKSERKKPLPKSISNPSYHRKKAASFHDAVEQATGWKIGRFPWCPQVVKQELWDWQDDDIMAAITGSTEVGSRIYRYFEELVGVSIHVVVIKDGNFESLVPRHRNKYVWSPPYPKQHIVVFETHRTTYGNRSCCYDYLTKESATMFDEGDSVVSYLTVQKAKDCVLPAQYDGIIHEQIIDRNGKCCRVTYDDGRHELTFTRPMTVPVIPEQACFFDFHVKKLNVAKQELGLKPLDLSKRSNNDVLYFPNEASFARYVDIHS